MEAIASKAPAGAAERMKPAYPTIKESWGFLGWYILVALLVGVPLYLLAEFVLKLPASVSFMLITIASNLALFSFLRWKNGKQRLALHLAAPQPLWLYTTLPLLVVAEVLVLTLLQYLHLPNWSESFFKELIREPVSALFTGVILAPVLEELLFRGVLLQGLLRNYRPWVAIGQSSLLFGLVHFNPAQSLSAAFGGVLLGWLYYRTRSLWVCIAAHALHNLLAFGSILLFLDASDTMMLFGSSWVYAGAVLISAVVLTVLLRRIYQATKPLVEA